MGKPKIKITNRKYESGAWLVHYDVQDHNGIGQRVIEIEGDDKLTDADFKMAIVHLADFADADLVEEF